MDRASKKQEAELQQLVNEIQEDIKNEDFDAAYIKAKQIRYTKDWSSGAALWYYHYYNVSMSKNTRGVAGHGKQSIGN